MTGRSSLKVGGGALLLLALLLLSGTQAQAKVTRYLTGNAADVSPALAGPAHDFLDDKDRGHVWELPSPFGVKRVRPKE